MTRVAVLGAGAWGTALAAALARSDREVRLWGRDAAALAAIAREHRNDAYLPGIALPPLETTSDPVDAMEGAAAVLLVVPVAATDAVVAGIAVSVPQNTTIVCCSKGIDPERSETPSETVRRLLPDRNVAVLSGPSFAHDVASGRPTAVTLAAPTLPRALKLVRALSGGGLRLYAHDDVRGVELGGALKNVMAIAVGAVRGLELGASAEAAVIARGFDELARVAVHEGARRETLNGLSGLGDLVLSCSSERSRNFAYGAALGRGEPTDALKLAEGVRTARTAAEVSRRNGLGCALIEGIDRLLRNELAPRALVEELLARPLKAEGDGARPVRIGSRAPR